MTKFDAAWVEAREKAGRVLAETGMYLPEEEHASCGVGLVVAVDGKPRRQVVQAGIRALS
ncbi:MAG: glutamate synthase (NADPH/NADH) large chain, partial [Paracoccaceae bacterium]